MEQNGFPTQLTPPRPAKRVDIFNSNNWVWFGEVLEKSVFQNVANLGTGFIEYNPPQFLIDAHAKSLDFVEYNQYGPYSGMPEFKKAIADTYSPLIGRSIDPESEVCVTSGATEGLLSAVMGFVEPGEEVILLEPVFSAYTVYVEVAGGVARYVPLHPPSGTNTKTSLANDWTLDLKELEAAITKKTKMIIFNNPNNPVGKVFTTDELHAIGDICVRNSVIMVADEVYSRLAFTSTFTQLATISPSIAANTITVGSIGKLFNATGWRLGYAIGPPTLIKPVQGAHYLLSYTTAGPLQKASIRALQEADQNGWWEQNRREAKEKVDSFCEVLDELEIPYVYPSAAYFIFVNTASIHIPSNYKFPPDVASKSCDMRLCWFLVNEIGVASIPGTTFYGPDNAGIGENYLRFGLCKTDEGLELAKSRLRKLKPLLAKIESGAKDSLET